MDHQYLVRHTILWPNIPEGDCDDNLRTKSCLIAETWQCQFVLNSINIVRQELFAREAHERCSQPLNSHTRDVERGLPHHNVDAEQMY